MSHLIRTTGKLQSRYNLHKLFDVSRIRVIQPITTFGDVMLYSNNDILFFFQSCPDDRKVAGK